MPNLTLREALALYQRLGLSIIPIAYKGKMPLMKWEEYQHRKPTQDELVEWWDKYWADGRSANIGIVCGKVSGNLLVLDFDNPANRWAGFLSHIEMRYGKTIYELTLVVATSRGFHVYFKITQPPRSCKLDGIEVRGEGSYVIAPPSVHPSGAIYQFVNPDVTEILQIDSLEEIGIKLDRKETGYEQGWVEKALEGVTEGERDNACIRLAGHYKARGLRYEETLTLLKDWALKCKPPFPEKEVEKCIKSAYGYLEKEAQNQAQALAYAKEMALKWLKLRDTDSIDIALAVVAANKAPGDPAWLLMVGAPSTGKSEILRGLFGCKDVHPLGGFTANTFASGFERVGVGLLEILPKEITLVVKDFGTLLSMRHEDRAIVLQQLREIYDGEYKKEYGNGKVVRWEGRMGLLGATTSAIENYHSVIGELGNRYILYRCDSEEDRGEIALRALADEGEEARMRREIGEAFKSALDNCPEAGRGIIPEPIQRKLAILANLTSQLRSPVPRTSYDKTVNYMPDIEGPARLAKAFAKLGKGLSAVRGKLKMTEEEYEVIRRIAEDTIPRKRAILVKLLLDGGRWWRVKAISKETNIPTSTTSYELEDLTLVGILNRDVDLEEGEELKQQTPYEYQLKQQVENLIRETGMFNNCSLKNGNR